MIIIMEGPSCRCVASLTTKTHSSRHHMNKELIILSQCVCMCRVCLCMCMRCVHPHIVCMCEHLCVCGGGRGGSWVHGEYTPLGVNTKIQHSYREKTQQKQHSYML